MDLYSYMANPSAAWHSWWTPIQQRMDTAFLRNGMQRMAAAQNAPYGSLAKQWDPSDYGSQFRRWAPSIAANDPAAASAAFSGMNRRPSTMPYYM